MTHCQTFDPDTILDEIARNRISLLNCTPSNFYLLLSDSEKISQLDSLRTVFLGGEPIDLAKLAPWRNHSGSVAIEYCEIRLAGSRVSCISRS
ncbi:AMP-binding protein [Planctomycetota bacterium]